MNKYKRRYARHVKRLVKHETKAEYEMWLAKLQQTLDDESLVDDLFVELTELINEEHDTGIGG
jgi:hypothetical protein